MRRDHNRRALIETVLVLSVFLGLVVGFFHDVLFGPNTLVATNPYLHPPWRHYATGPDLARRPGIPDSFGAYLPRRVELSRSISAGRFPLWNPYVFGGTPFFADPQARVFYPISLLLVPLEPGRAMGYDVAIHVFLAMLGMFVFLRALDASHAGACLGGIAYGLSSFIFKEIAHPSFVASAAWVPFVFYGFEIARKSERLGTLLLTFALVMTYLAGFPQIVLLGATALVVYALSLSVESLLSRNRSEAIRHVRILGISGGLSLLIVAVQLLPFYEFVRNGVGLRITLEQMKEYLSHPVGLVRTLLPDFFAGYAEGTSWADVFAAKGRGITGTSAAYCGVSTLLAAVGSLVFLPRSRNVRALWAVLILSAGLATSAFILTAAYAVVPFISYAQIGRITLVMCFAFAALAAMGLSHASSGDRQGRLLFVVVIAALCGALAVFYLLLSRGGWPLSGWLAGAAAQVRDTSGPGVQASIAEWLADGGARWIAFEKGVVARGLALSGASLAFLACYLFVGGRNRRLARCAAAAIVLLVVVDLVAAHRTLYARQPAAGFRSVPGIETLRELLGGPGQWRTLAAKRRARVLPVNANQIFDISSLGGRCTIQPQGFADLVRARARAGTRWEQAVISRSRPTSEIDDLMSGRFIRADSLDPRFLSAPLSASLARDRDLREHLRIFEADGQSSSAFVSRIGDSLSFNVKFPAANYLDFQVACDAAGGAARETVRLVLICESARGRAVFDRISDLSADAGGWHRFRLDLASASGAEGRITMCAAPDGPEGCSATRVAWSGIQFVIGECTVYPAEQGYRLSAPSESDMIGLDVASTAREIPLEIRWGDSDRMIRWVGFPRGKPARQIYLAIPHQKGKSILVRSDSAFTILGAKTVAAPFPHLADYDLVYDEDMTIYENFAAVEKGICITRRGGQIEYTDDGARQLKIGAPESIRSLQCGGSRIVEYLPEKVVLEVSSTDSCFLLFQDIYYPGWKATVDGRPTEVFRTDIGIRALELAGGKHRVVMAFRPLSLKIGLAISCLGLLLTATYWRLSARKHAGVPA